MIWVALILSILAIVGLIFHAALADFPQGIAHRDNAVNRWLVSVFPSLGGARSLDELSTPPTPRAPVELRSVQPAISDSTAFRPAAFA